MSEAGKPMSLRRWNALRRVFLAQERGGAGGGLGRLIVTARFTLRRSIFSSLAMARWLWPAACQSRIVSHTTGVAASDLSCDVKR